MICTHQEARTTFAMWNNRQNHCPSCRGPVVLCDTCNGFGLDKAATNYDTCTTCRGSGIVTATQRRSTDREVKR